MILFDKPSPSVSILRRLSSELQRKKFLLGLHYLRGIASVLVWYGHMGSCFLKIPQAFVSDTFHIKQLTLDTSILREKYLWVISVDEFIYRIGALCGTIGVLVFFLLSGFLVCRNNLHRTTAQFWKIRFLRIYPTHIFALGLLFALAATASKWLVPAPFNPDWRSIVGSALLTFQWFPIATPFSSVLWSMGVEELFYYSFLLYIVAHLCFKRLSPAIYFSILTVAISTFEAALYLLKTYKGLNEPFFLIAQTNSVFYVFPFLMFLVLGVYIHELISLRPRIFHSCILLLTWLVGFGFSAYMFRWRLNSLGLSLPGAANFIFAVFFFLAALVAELFSIRKSAVLSFFGDISFPLYLIHIPVGLAFYLFFKDTFSRPAITWVLAALLSFPVAWVVHVSIEKWSLRRIRTISKKP